MSGHKHYREFHNASLEELCVTAKTKSLDKFIIAYNGYLLNNGAAPQGKPSQRLKWYKGLMKTLKEIQ